MNQNTMRIISVVGSLGAGKTTFVRRTIESLASNGYPTRDKVAYVVNDAGNHVDGQMASEAARVIAMTNGCFTCLDTADLKRTLQELQESGIAWAFLEGFGLISGQETRQFLESCGYPFHVICLLSAVHHGRDLVRYSGVLRSQAGAATAAIGITKHHGTSLLADDAPCGVLDFVAAERPGIPIMLIRDDSPIPTPILDLFSDDTLAEATSQTSRPRQPAGATKACTDMHAGCCSHACSHQHGHHVHDAYTYSFGLRDGVTFAEIRNALQEKDFLLRIKGAVAGLLFNEVHGTWEQTTGDPRRFVTFYASREVDIERDLPGLASLIVIGNTDNADEKPSYAQLREDVGTREDTVHAIQDLIAESPSKPIIIPTEAGLRMLTHPESMQNAKEISRRPSVIDEWFPRVLLRFMEYWIQCANVLKTHGHEIIPEDIGKNRYELAVSMVWWTNRFGEHFGSEILRVVDGLRLGAMAAEGIMSLQSLVPIAHPETVSWQCLEFTEALRHGLERSEDRETMIAAARHCLSLATTPDLQDAWSKSIRGLESIQTD